MLPYSAVACSASRAVRYDSTMDVCLCGICMAKAWLCYSISKYTCCASCKQPCRGSAILWAAGQILLGIKHMVQGWLMHRSCTS